MIEYYEYKTAPKINSAADLIAFLEPIPEESWCVDIRDDGCGRCCVLGHIDRAYRRSGGAEYNTDGFTMNELAVVNNGVAGQYANNSPRKPDAGIDGASVKKRVLDYLRQNIHR